MQGARIIRLQDTDAVPPGAARKTVILRRGDTIEIQPGAWHGFRVSGVDARGYRK